MSEGARTQLASIGHARLAMRSVTIIAVILAGCLAAGSASWDVDGSGAGGAAVLGDAEHCDLVVVGAGMGGLYTARRLIKDGPFPADRTCVFEMTGRVGGRAYSVRGDDLPPELRDLGTEAVDVGAYRAWPAHHPILASLWGELGIHTECYHDAAFRTGDCTLECNRPIFRFVRDVHIDHADWSSSSANSPYNFGSPWGEGEARETYKTPWDWLFGEFAPQFVQDEREALESGSSAAVRWAARNRMLKAAATAVLGGLPATQTSPLQLARNGVGSGGVAMTQEDIDFYLDTDCGSTGSNVADRLRFYHLLEQEANYKANGVDAGLGGNYSLPVDPLTDGQIGFATPVEMIAKELQAMGVDLRFREELVGVELHDDTKALTLTFASGREISPVAAVLNIPPNAFEGVVRKDDREGPKALPFLGEWLAALERVPALKAYVYYDDAFWATLNLTSGRMRTTLELYNSRYHDGFVRCDDYGKCKGILLAQYAMGDRGTPWASSFFQEPLDSPFVHIRRNSSDPSHVQFLDELHAQLMVSHTVELQKVGLSPSDIPVPDVALVGVFLGNPLYGWHGRRPSKLSPGQFEEAAIQPFPGYALHLVNEAYGPTPGWMESSLVIAERMLHHVYGLERPDFLTEANAFVGFDPELYYENMIRNFAPQSENRDTVYV